MSLEYFGAIQMMALSHLDLEVVNKINMECLKCKYDVSDLMNWDTLLEKYIECPNCNNKMIVEYDESYDEENDENGWWWLEQYFE